MGFIPQDIVFNEILPKLSVQSLAKFKSVSKTWSAIISNDPNIVPDRFHAHILKGKQSTIYFQLQFPQKLFLLVEDYSEITEIDKSFLSKRQIFSVLGSCNGLICLKLYLKDLSDSLTMLWNPLTGANRIIPQPLNTFGSTLCHIDLGYDKIGNDYKIVLIESVVLSDKYVLNFQVFSRYQSWRQQQMEDWSDFDFDHNNNAIQIGGAMYWNVYKCGFQKKHCILSFDLYTEEVLLIDGPNKSNYIKVEIMEWEGSLGVIMFTKESVCEFWVRRQNYIYTKGIWIKMFDFSNLSVSCNSIIDRLGDRFICREDEKLFLFDVVKNKRTEFGKELRSYSKLVEYFPSLVSPN